MRVVHGVRDWKEFGRKLFILSDISDYDARLQAIKQQHGSDGKYLHGVVEEWFKGYHQSWRQVIFALDLTQESVVADRIRGYAEPPRGEWSDNCCVMRDLVIVSCPTTPISVEGLVSVAQLFFSEFERKQSLQLDASTIYAALYAMFLTSTLCSPRFRWQ